MMKDLAGFRRVGESALRHLADMFADDTNPVAPEDVSVDATIVFADIEGFSDLVAREGDDAATVTLDRLDLAVEQALADTVDTRLVKRLGDGVMITSSDPGEGVLVAAALPVAFAAGMADLPFHLRLRVGAHRGVVRQRGEDLIGYHVNVAARVAEQAPGGQAILTRALLDSVSLHPPLVAIPAGELVAKGVPERPPLFRLTTLPPLSEPLSATPGTLPA